MSANQREGDDEPILGGELEAHLEVVLEELAVETEEGEIGGEKVEECSKQNSHQIFRLHLAFSPMADKHLD